MPIKIKELLGLEAVLFIPAGISPFKKDKGQTSGFHRINMLKIALRKKDNVFISDYEVEKTEKNGDVSYTIDTFNYIASMNKSVDFTILVGSDILASFHKWKGYGDLIKNKIIIAKRGNEFIPDVWKDKVIDVDGLDQVSSTEIRNQIKNNIKPDKLDVEVYNYVIENKLYLF